MTKSDQIRKMTDEGKKVHEIAKELNANYSFVYGVIQRYKEFGPPVDRKANSKSQKIRDLYNQGKTIPEIRKELDLDYAHVYTVIRKMKEANNNGKDQNN